MDDEEFVFDPTYGGADISYQGPTDTTDWYDSYIADLEFDEDWADVVGGRFTIDEATSNEDIAANIELAAFGSDWKTVLSNLAGKLGKGAFNALKGAFTKPNGDIDWAALATAGVGLYNQSKGKETGGYNKPVPKMDVSMGRPQYDDTNRRPGEAGRRYFTDPAFYAQGDAAAKDAAIQATLGQKTALESAAPQYATPAPNPYAGKIPTSFSKQRVLTPAATGGLPAVADAEKLTEEGGLKMAKGGIADAGRYLQGKTDGMADKIPTSIDGKDPAALSHGEFVIPADVVSHLGNGNSEAGAEKLYEMMARIRKARTGNAKQGKEIDADKFTMGGLTAAYAQGGKIKGFDGTAGSAVIAGPTTAAPAATSGGGIQNDVSRTSTLSPWVGDYVTDALGKGAALADAPYQAYEGPLTAGASDLQTKAFAGASDIASAGYTPGEFIGGFTADMAGQYMNPYLQTSLDPQLKELKRQSDIARLDDASRLTKAGAFGGSRQAIMESEGRRNLLDKQSGLIGSAYKTAYDTGLGQFNKEREAEEASRQFGANYGLKTIDQLANLGAVERGITKEGIEADKKQFEEERDFAYKMPQYQLGLLSGLPIGSNTTSIDQDTLSKLQSDISGLASLYKTLSALKV